MFLSVIVFSRRKHPQLQSKVTKSEDQLHSTEVAATPPRPGEESELAVFPTSVGPLKEAKNVSSISGSLKCQLHKADEYSFEAPKQSSADLSYSSKSLDKPGSQFHGTGKKELLLIKIIVMLRSV